MSIGIYLVDWSNDIERDWALKRDWAYKLPSPDAVITLSVSNFLTISSNFPHFLKLFSTYYFALSHNAVL